MRSTLPFAALAGSLVLVVAVAAPGEATRPIATDSAPHAEVGEVPRIRAHFDSVLTELPAHDVGHLTADQRARRAALITALGAYRDRGLFPRNHDFGALPMPYFVDRESGVLCAVAHLLESTGRRDIVDRVARTNNNVWVMELRGDSAFTGWLDRSGLTLAEAARIQVPYVETASKQSTAMTTGSAVAFGGALAASFWNARTNASGSGRRANLLGLTAGALAAGMGTATVYDGGGSPTVGAAAAVAGVASMWLATRGIVRHRRDVAHRSTESREAPRATIAPILPVSGVSGAGASVTLRF